MRNWANKIGKVLLALGLFFLIKEFSKIGILVYSVALIGYVFFMNYDRNGKIALGLFIVLIGSALYFGPENIPLFVEYELDEIVKVIQNTSGFSFILIGIILLSLGRIKRLLLRAKRKLL